MQPDIRLLDGVRLATPSGD